MSKSQSLIPMYYQYFSEAIAFFFVLYFIGNWSWVSVAFPLTTHLFIALLILVSLSIISKLSPNMAAVFLTLAGITTGGVWLGVPIVFMVMLTGFLGWRYLLHLQDPDQENERFLLLFSTMAAFVCLSLSGQAILVVALAIQYSITIVGYYYFHYSRVPKSDRKNGKNSIVVLMLIFIAGTAALASLFYPLRFAVSETWQGVMTGVTRGVQGVLQILNLEDAEVNDQSSTPQIEFEQENTPLDSASDQPFSGESTSSSIFNENTIWIIVILVVAITVMVFLSRRIRRYFVSEQDHNNGVIYEAYHLQNEKDDFEQARTFNRTDADNAIRKHFLKFELYAKRYGMAREPYEPLENWLDRIGIQTRNIHLYQKVRYGNERLTKQEETQFYKEIDVLKEQIKAKGKNNH